MSKDRDPIEMDKDPFDDAIIPLILGCMGCSLIIAMGAAALIIALVVKFVLWLF